MQHEMFIHWRRIILSACRLKRIPAGSRQDRMRRFTGGCRRGGFITWPAILDGVGWKFGPYFVIAPGPRCRMAARKKGVKKNRFSLRP